jgi:acyl carrier protein
VLEVLVELEQRFGITIDGEDVTIEAFETLASLTTLVEQSAR